MGFDWKSSPLYLKYQSVCWGDDSLLIARIIDEGLSSPNPAERACWLTMKANQIGERLELSDRLNRAWDALDEAVATAPAPEEHQFRAALVQMILVILNYEGPVHRAWSLLRQMQPGVSRYVQEPAIRFNIAVLYQIAGRFRQAQIWVDRAFHANYLDTKSALGKVNALSFRAWVLALQSHPADGEADLREARRLFDLHGGGRIRLYSLAMAETWMALEQGRLQDARASLQEFMARSPYKHLPMYMFQSNVLAARLALAEGSLTGYRHYRDQAQAVCEEYDLTLSRSFLKAIMAGVEQE